MFAANFWLIRVLFKDENFTDKKILRETTKIDKIKIDGKIIFTLKLFLNIKFTLQSDSDSDSDYDYNNQSQRLQHSRFFFFAAVFNSSQDFRVLFFI